MSQIQQELQNWTGGALNIIKLIEKAPSFATLCWKLKTNIISEILKNFENLKEKKNQNSALCSTHWPPDNWPGALDHLAIGLVDKKYTKLGKIDEKSATYFGVGPYKSPTVLSWPKLNFGYYFTFWNHFWCKLEKEVN